MSYWLVHVTSCCFFSSIRWSTFATSVLCNGWHHTCYSSWTDCQNNFQGRSDKILWDSLGFLKQVKCLHFSGFIYVIHIYSLIYELFLHKTNWSGLKFLWGLKIFLGNGPKLCKILSYSVRYGMHVACISYFCFLTLRMRPCSLIVMVIMLRHSRNISFLG